MGSPKESKEEKRKRKLEKKARHLFDDIKAGAVIEVQRRIGKKPALLEAEDDKGRSCLHIAASSGSYQICLLLLRRGAKVNKVDKAGNTPLHLAAKSENWAVAEVLLQKGANRECLNLKGKTPSSYGLDEALKEIQEEDERLRQKEEWVLEERSRHAKGSLHSEGSIEDAERSWRDKLRDEHDFEHLEGGRPSWHAPAFSSQGWFEEEDLSDDDWWAAIARQMRRRHAAFSAPPSAPPPPSPKAEPAGRWAAGSQARMAWERRWAREGEAGRATPPARKPGGPDTAAAAAAHALAWDRFLSACLGGSGPPLCYDDVPWPPVRAGGGPAEEAEAAVMLPPGGAEGGEGRRRGVREALRRWHPDKFEGRFVHRIAVADRPAVLTRVSRLAQALTAMLT